MSGRKDMTQEFGFIRGKGKVDSAFRLDIKNTLGISATAQRNKLKTFALQSPTEYSKLREVVYEAVVSDIVEEIHNTVWDLLSNGKNKSLDNGRISLDGSNGWAPKLPDAEIGEISNGLARSIMESFTDIMERMMPDSFRELADNKLLTSATVNIASAQLGDSSGSGRGDSSGLGLGRN